MMAVVDRTRAPGVLSKTKGEFVHRMSLYFFDMIIHACLCICQTLKEMLDQVSDYVDKVVKGEEEPNSAVGT